MSGHDDSPTSLIHASTAFDSTGIISLQYLIANLGLKMHPEGGYYVETDRDPLQVPNPFLLQDQEKPASTSPSGSLLLPPPPLKQQLAEEPLGDNSTRSAGTSIYYLLTPGDPKGSFHRNKGRTIHTLYQGRGRYVIIHADEVQSGGKARIETFVVGHNVQNGERLQWVVEGGKYKASFLLPDGEDSSTSKGLLISETVVPGFEFRDHNFMTAATLKELVSIEQYDELCWLLLRPSIEIVSRNEWLFGSGRI